MKKLAVVLLSSALLVSSQSWSASKYVVGMGAGWQNYSKYRDFKNDDILGMHFGYRLNQRWGLETLYFTSETQGESSLDIQARRLHLAGHYHLKPYKLIQPYLGSGIGEATFKTEQNDSHETLVNFSAGIYIAPTGWDWPIRIAYNNYYSADNDVFDNTFMISFSHFFGPELTVQRTPNEPPNETPPAITQAETDDSKTTPTVPTTLLAGAVFDNVEPPSDESLATVIRFKISDSCNLHNCNDTTNPTAMPEIKIKFAVDSSEIPQESQRAVATLANYLKQNSQQQIIFEGHSDARGTRDYNKTLSIKRATRLKYLLVDQYAVNPHRIKVLGFGEDRPIASNDSKAGRAQNRRIEIQIVPSVAATREPF